MNVCLGPITVMGMLPVTTLMEALTVCVMKDTMEMENYARLLVRLLYINFEFACHWLHLSLSPSLYNDLLP